VRLRKGRFAEQSNATPRPATAAVVIRPVKALLRDQEPRPCIPSSGRPHTTLVVRSRWLSVGRTYLRVLIVATSRRFERPAHGVDDHIDARWWAAHRGSHASRSESRSSRSGTTWAIDDHRRSRTPRLQKRRVRAGRIGLVMLNADFRSPASRVQVASFCSGVREREISEFPSPGRRCEHERCDGVVQGFVHQPSDLTEPDSTQVEVCRPQVLS